MYLISYKTVHLSRFAFATCLCNNYQTLVEVLIYLSEIPDDSNQRSLYWTKYSTKGRCCHFHGYAEVSKSATEYQR